MKKENQDLKIVDEHQEQIVFETNSFFDKLKEWFHNTLSISNKSYDRILAGAEHPAECIAVYMHLVRTARWQKTNSVWANNSYIKNGLKLGDKRLKRAKAELRALKLIDYIQKRNDKGQLGDTYIVIKYLPTFKGLSTGGSKTAPPVNRTTGKDEQMLKERNEVLKEDSPDEGFPFEQKESKSKPISKNKSAFSSSSENKKKAITVEICGYIPLTYLPGEWAALKKAELHSINTIRAVCRFMEQEAKNKDRRFNTNPKGFIYDALFKDYNLSGSAEAWEQWGYDQYDRLTKTCTGAGDEKRGRNV